MRRAAEDGPPRSQFKLCVIVFTPGGADADDAVRANERAWAEWKQDMAREEHEVRATAQREADAMQLLLAGDSDAESARSTESAASAGSAGAGAADVETDGVSSGGDAATARGGADADPGPGPDTASGSAAGPSEPGACASADASGAGAAPRPRPGGTERIRLTSMRAFWGLLRFLDSYTLGACAAHGVQGDWHEGHECECGRVPSLLSYVVVGTERWVFDLGAVADDVPADAPVPFDTAAWVADVHALRAERPGTPDFQLMLEAGLARWYDPADADTYNDILDHVHYDSADGFRNRYAGENYALVMRP